MRAAGEQAGHEACRLHYLLEIVEQQQEPFIPQEVAHLLGWRLIPLLAESQGLRYRLRHQGRLTDSRQFDPGHVAREIRAKLAGDLQRQPRLAHANRPGQGQQAPGQRGILPAQNVERLAQLLLAAQERGRRQRQDLWGIGCASAGGRAGRAAANSAARAGRQLQSLRQQIERVVTRRAAAAPLQVADRAGAEAGPFGQRLLG